MSCEMSFKELAIVTQYVFYNWTSFHQKFEKKYPRDDLTHKVFLSSLNRHPIFELRSWAWIAHSGWVGGVRDGNRRDCRRLLLEFKSL